MELSIAPMRFDGLAPATIVLRKRTWFGGVRPEMASRDFESRGGEEIEG